MSKEKYQGPELAEQDELLTVAEVATRLRVNDTTVRRWIRSGAIASIALPHMNKRQAYRVRASTLETLLNTPAALRPTADDPTS